MQPKNKNTDNRTTENDGRVAETKRTHTHTSVGSPEHTRTNRTARTASKMSPRQTTAVPHGAIDSCQSNCTRHTDNRNPTVHTHDRKTCTSWPEGWEGGGRLLHPFIFSLSSLSVSTEKSLSQTFTQSARRTVSHGPLTIHQDTKKSTSKLWQEFIRKKRRWKEKKKFGATGDGRKALRWTLFHRELGGQQYFIWREKCDGKEHRFAHARREGRGIN